MAEPLGYGLGPHEVVAVHLAGGVAVGDGGLPAPRPPPLPARQLGGEVAAALEGLLEGHPELAVEVGVDKGVEGGVEVTNPEDQGHHPGGAVADPVAAEGADHVPGTEDESQGMPSLSHESNQMKSFEDISLVFQGE